MTTGEYFEKKWFYMKYIGKYLSVEILLTCECTLWSGNIDYMCIHLQTERKISPKVPFSSSF